MNHRGMRPHRAALHGYRAVRRIQAERGDEYQDRWQLDLEDFLRLEATGMTSLFWYWRELRLAGRGRGLPSFDDVKFEHLVEMGMHEWVNLIDVRPDAPGAFTVSMQATVSYVRSHVDLRGKALASFPSKLHSIGLQEDYQSVKELGVPRYHEIHNRVDGRDRAYSRLTLPFSRDGRTVDMLLLGMSLAPASVPLSVSEPEPAE